MTKGSKPRFRNLPVDAIKVDERYQRSLSMPRVKKIMRRFDWAQFGALEVSEHGGQFVVFDGQHRLAALRELGIDQAPCLVHRLSPEEEAALFVRLQLDRKPPSQIERFTAEVFSGNEQAVAIKTIAAGAGFQITGSKVTNGIRAVVALERIYKRVGGPGLRETLQFVNDVWGGDERSMDGYFLEGVGQFLAGYGARVDDDARRRLAETAPVVILRRALGSMQGGGSHARHAIDTELRKVAGVRGKPTLRPSLKLVAA